MYNRLGELLFTLNVFLLSILLFALRDAGLLVLLILRYKIIHVGLCLGKLHLIHALASVPVQESLATEHRAELVTNALEQFLDGGGVADKRRDILRPRGGIEQSAVWTLLGIHSTK